MNWMNRLTYRKHDYERTYCPRTVPCESRCDDCEHMDKMMNKLADYEDAEEQGKLLMAPCKIGNTVWVITSLYNLGFDGNDECEIFECTVDAIAFYKSGRSQVRLYFVTEYFNEHVRFDDFGKTVFLTKEEAEVVLEKMKGE